MSDTPRTDAEAFDITTGKPYIDGVVMADFARELERENATLQDEIVKANGLLDMRMKEIAKLKQTLIEVTTELTVIKVKDNLK